MKKAILIASFAMVNGLVLAQQSTNNVFRVDQNNANGIVIQAYSNGQSQLEAPVEDAPNNDPVPIVLNDLSSIVLDYGSESSCVAAGGTSRVIDYATNQYGSWCQSTANPMPTTGWNYFEFLSHISGICSFTNISLSTKDMSVESTARIGGVIPNSDFYYVGLTNVVINNGVTTRDLSSCMSKSVLIGLLHNADTGEIYMSRNGSFEFFGNDPVTRANPVGIIAANTPYRIGLTTTTNAQKVDVGFLFSGYGYTPTGIYTDALASN